MHTLNLKDRTRMERITMTQCGYIHVWTEDSALLTDWLIMTWSNYFTMRMVSQQNRDSGVSYRTWRCMAIEWDWIECAINLCKLHYQRAADLTPSSPLLHKLTWDFPHLVNGCRAARANCSDIYHHDKIVHYYCRTSWQPHGQWNTYGDGTTVTFGGQSC